MFLERKENDHSCYHVEASLEATAMDGAKGNDETLCPIKAKICYLALYRKTLPPPGLS